jgi:PhnB protein
MSSRLNPYLNFNGNARQALEFFRSVFGGALAINTYADFGGPGSLQPPVRKRRPIGNPATR